MKAWTITEDRKLELVTEAGRPADPGCVKIKISHVLVSNVDLNAFTREGGHRPVIPGGSCCGMVVETGEGVRDLERGDRVFVGPDRFCGECPECKAGRYASCENVSYRGSDCDGFIRDFAVVRAEDCTKLPERISDKEAVFLDYISTAVDIMSTLNAEKGEHIAISGAGALGCILAQVALYYQAVPILVDIDAEFLAKAAAMGVYYTVNTVENDARTKIFHITGGKMAECAVHIATAGSSVARTLSFAGRGGRVVVVGRKDCHSDLTCSLVPVVANELTVMGVTGAEKSTQTAINMLANKAVTVLPLITVQTTFDEVPEVFAQAAATPFPHMKIIVSDK